MTAPPIDTSSLAIVTMSEIRPSDYNPRTLFDEAELKDLAASIAEHGLLEPIVLRPIDNEPSSFEIVAGERRFRACQLVGFTQIPAVIKEVDRSTAMALSIVENVKRSDITPVEEAQAYKRLRDDCGLKPKKIADLVGRSTDAVNRTLQLTEMPQTMQDLVAQGQWTATDLINLHKFRAFPEVLNHIYQRHKGGRPPHESYNLADHYQLLNDRVIENPGRADTAFDWQSVCPKCPFGAYHKLGAYTPYCLKPEHFDALQAAAIKDQNDANAVAIAEHAQTGVQLVDSRTVRGQVIYQDLKPSGCTEQCPCRVAAVTNGRTVQMCTDPNRLTRLQAKDTRAKNKRRKLHAEELQQRLDETLAGYLKGHSAAHSNDYLSLLVALVCSTAIKQGPLTHARQALGLGGEPGDYSFTTPSHLASIDKYHALAVTVATILGANLKDYADNSYGGNASPSATEAFLTAWNKIGKEQP